MSANCSITYSCDWAGCARKWESNDYESMQETDQVVVADGWVTTALAGRDLCSKHAGLARGN